MTFHRINKIEVAYINEKGIRRVGNAFEVTKDGEFFKILHKAGYYEIVNADQIAA
ncbi:hypothetical protein [Mesorhizobium sp.]|uniref:hypothetical protein n=1 Tax=Mesorhizobium sp. TaxID=1871066 RepID=UPI00257C235B|nr:hypothetical protein [Mesorhizobium sp.]